ncbi:MAG: kdpC [Ilumatobacteraceae bacterium]|nr:kdpC [Ilumatobacteraceae bacterium]
MHLFLRQLRSSVIVLAVFTVVLGIAYPLLNVAIGQVAFGDKANGSLIRRDGVVVGSELIGQSFTAPQYFHPRPSAAGAGYDGSASSGSNLGPLSPDLLAAVEQRAADYRAENGLPADYAVPVDAVTASASGLDPHITIANARLQAARVARERGLDTTTVDRLIEANTDGRDLAVLGEPGVNVLKLNLALDALTS